MKLFPLLTPAGSDTQIQYNNGGIFGGTSYLTLNDATGVTTATALTVTGNCVLGLNSAVFQPTADSTTFFQVKNAAGTVIPFNVDTTNEMVGIRNTSPEVSLDVANVLRITGGTNSNNDYPTTGVGFEIAYATDYQATGVAGTGTTIFQCYDRDNTAWKDLWFRANNIGFEPVPASAVDNTLYLKNDGTVGIRTTSQTCGLGINAVVQILGSIAPGYPTEGVGFEFAFDTDNNHLQGAGNGVAVFQSYDRTASAWRDIFFGGNNITFGANGSNVVTFLNSGNVGIGETDPETHIEMTSTVSYITFHNNTHEDTDGGRESRINFKGEQSGGEETTLARIEVSHDGAADDEKGKIGIYTNDGNDADAPILRMTIDSAGATDVVGAFTAGTVRSDDGVSGALVLDDGGTEKITLVFTGGILTSRTVEATTSGVLIDWTD